MIDEISEEIAINIDHHQKENPEMKKRQRKNQKNRNVIKNVRKMMMKRLTTGGYFKEEAIKRVN